MRGTTNHPRAAWLLAAFLLAGAEPAAAAILNPSFETGDTSDWTTVGNVSVTDSSFGVNPVYGSYQLLLGTNGVDVNATEAAMNLASGTLQSIFDSYVPSTGSGPIQGAAFQQTFQVTDGGDDLNFYYNLLTNEAVPESVSTDYLWWHLDRPLGSEKSGVIAHVNEAGFSSSGTSYDWETGYQTFTIHLSLPGTYTLTIGLHDVEDGLRDTAAIFDGFSLDKTPEPSTFLLLAAGLVGLAFHARRHKSCGTKS